MAKFTHITSALREISPIFLIALVLMIEINENVWADDSQYIPAVDPQVDYRAGKADKISIPLTSIPIDNDTLPVTLEFHEAAAGDSFFGRGWHLPLVDSYFVQISPHHYDWFTPDGKHLYPKVKPKHPTDDYSVKNSNGVINVTTSFGWTYEYQGGRIKSITTNTGKSITFKNSDDGGTSVEMDGQELLNVNRDEHDPTATDLTVMGTRYHCQLDKRPVVQSSNNVTVISALVYSLSKITINGKPLYSLNFDVDAALNPSVNVSKEGGPSTPIALNSVADSRPVSDVATSTTKGGAVDYTTPDQLQVHRDYFVSGDLYGKLRDETVTFPDGHQISAQYIYDENGNCIQTKRTP